MRAEVLAVIAVCLRSELLSVDVLNRIRGADREQEGEELHGALDVYGRL